MAFGQQNGRPATGRQVQTLASLLEAAGYSDFRDARGPMGFTQRQAGGKFTADEADAFIEQLEAEAEAGEGDEAPEPEPTERNRRATPVPKRVTGVAKASTVSGPKPDSTVAERREARQAVLVRDLPAKVLARELERRGWILIPPEDLTATDPSTGPGPG